MLNYYLDKLRSSSKHLGELKKIFREKISDKRVLVLGSAPCPTLPKTDDYIVICINGSVYSAYKHLDRPSDLCYLNGAIFKKNDLYSNATLQALNDKNIGDAIISKYVFEQAIELLKKNNTIYQSIIPISRYEKRVVLAEVTGYSLTGFYEYNTNISNGLFMAAFSIWCGASETILSGFSFGSMHEYSKKLNLSPRGHIKEDKRFLKILLERDLAFSTTEKSIHHEIGVPLIK